MSFFMVPLYTHVLSTADYGTYDILNATIGPLIPLLTVDIQEAVLRFSVEEDSERDKVFSTGLYYVILSTLILLAFTGINYYFGFIKILKDYASFFVLLYGLNALSGILVYFARGTNQIRDISIGSVLSTAVMIASNLLFLVVFKFGLIGYFVASILGISAQVIYLLFKIDIHRYLRLVPRKDPIRREMVKYSTPMVANAIVWWTSSALDTYIVTWFCGISENGILSVGYKIPSIINIVQGIFGQAWTLSAVKDFDEKDSDGFFSNTYNVYNFLLVCMCSALIVLDKPLASFLFANDFFAAWRYSPFLLIGTVFSGMSAYIGGLLAAKKKTGTFAITSTITAAVNAGLNLVLIQFWGVLGAVFATALSYFLMWILRIRELKKYVGIEMDIHIKRDIAAYILLVIQAFALITIGVDRFFLGHQCVLFALIMVLYKKEVVAVLSQIKKIL